MNPEQMFPAGGRFVIRYDPSVTFMSTTTDDDGLPSPTREFSAALPVARWDDFVDALLLHTGPPLETRETQA